MAGDDLNLKLTRGQPGGTMFLVRSNVAQLLQRIFVNQEDTEFFRGLAQRFNAAGIQELETPRLNFNIAGYREVVNVWLGFLQEAANYQAKCGISRAQRIEVLMMMSTATAQSMPQAARVEREHFKLAANYYQSNECKVAMQDPDIKSSIVNFKSRLANPMQMPVVVNDFLDACKKEPFARDAVKLQNFKYMFALLLFTINTQALLQMGLVKPADVQLGAEIQTRLLT